MAIERHENLLLWQKAYDLAKEILIVTEKFPRPQQRDGGLANETRGTGLRILRKIMLANNRKDVAINHDIDQQVEYLQTLIRMGYELGYIGIGKYEILAERTVELGRMNAGWMKRIA